MDFLLLLYVVSIICLLTSMVSMLMSKSHVLSMLVFLEYYVLAFISLVLLMSVSHSSDSNMVMVLLCITVSSSALAMSLMVFSVRSIGTDSVLSISSLW